MTRNNRKFAAAGPSALLGCLALLGGCVEHRPPDELAQAVTMGERPVAMEGDGAFFDGKVRATVTISRGIGHGIPPGMRRKHSAFERPDREEVADVGAMENDDAVAYVKAKIAVGSPMPPVTLRLKLENKDASPASIEIADFSSELGNFAVTPDVLKLAPAEESEPEPMISQLGVTSDEIPVKVTLKMGGKSETRTVLVRNLSSGPK